MRTVRAKILTGVLSLIAVISMFPASANAATSGTSGSTKWTYSNNTITFSGKGATGSYSGSDVPWVDEGTSGAKTSLSVSKVISVAEGELQYAEKKSNSNLYDKRANIGSGNFTKYAADLFPSLQSNPWCDMFVSWCVWTASGKNKNTADKALCGGLNSAYTPYSASKYKSAGRWTTTDPKVGDQVFFQNGSRICHTGLVYKVTDEAIFTIEGNTTSGSSSSGGEVLRKKYARSYWKIAGYGHPIYSGSASGPTPLTINRVEFKEGVTKLGSYLFSHRNDVKTVVIPKSVTEFSAYAFSYCEGIEDVYYGGTAEDWKKLNFPTGNYYIQHADIHYEDDAPSSPVVSANGSASLKITSQPSDTTVESNKIHMFSVETNVANASYNWQVSENGGKTWRNFTEKKTSKTADLCFTVTAAMNGWQFRCKITKSGSTVTSKAFTVKVGSAGDTSASLKITKQPSKKTVKVGQVAIFKVKANKQATYQWQYKKPGAKKWKKLKNYKSAKTKMLAFIGRAKFNGYKYRCKVKSGSEVVYSKSVKVKVKK